MITLVLLAALGASAQVQTCPKGGCLDDYIKFSPLTLTWISPLAAPQETNVYGAGRSTAALGTTIPRPDARMTPGATNPALTKRLICSPTFRTGPYRNVSAGKKLAVCKAYEAYGIFKCPGSGYEMDHDIPLELGGSNDIENLWPQPADRRGVIGYHTKDVVENRAHAAVCSGTLSLEDAQKGIASDWYGFGIKYGFIPRQIAP